MTQISIFMSVFDCHVNRAPVEGRVVRVSYRPGLFVNADLDKASEDNERNGLVVDTAAGRFGVVQIAGLVARRIVCFTQEGERLGAGDRFGLIRFGSRVDVYLPDGAATHRRPRQPLRRRRDGDRADAARRAAAPVQSRLRRWTDPCVTLLSRPRFASVPLRVLVPNIVTLMALCAGVTAIRFTFEDSLEWAVMAIAAAAVLDGLDGRIARALKGTSRFGAELDSLADFVDFGVAPAILLYFSGLSQLRGLGWLVCLVFCIACALRLARFNVMIDDPDIPVVAQGFLRRHAGAGGRGRRAAAGLSAGARRRAQRPVAAAGSGLEAVYVLGHRAADGEPGAAFLGQVDRPGAARICRRRADRRRCGSAVDRLFPAAGAGGARRFYLGSIPFAIRRFRRLEPSIAGSERSAA